MRIKISLPKIALSAVLAIVIVCCFDIGNIPFFSALEVDVVDDGGSVSDEKSIVSTIDSESYLPNSETGIRKPSRYDKTDTHRGDGDGGTFSTVVFREDALDSAIDADFLAGNKSESMRHYVIDSLPPSSLSKNDHGIELSIPLLADENSDVTTADVGVSLSLTASWDSPDTIEEKDKGKHNLGAGGTELSLSLGDNVWASMLSTAVSVEGNGRSNTRVCAFDSSFSRNATGAGRARTAGGSFIVTWDDVNVSASVPEARCSVLSPVINGTPSLLHAITIRLTRPTSAFRLHSVSVLAFRRGSQDPNTQVRSSTKRSRVSFVAPTNEVRVEPHEQRSSFAVTREMSVSSRSTLMSTSTVATSRLAVSYVAAKAYIPPRPLLRRVRWTDLLANEEAPVLASVSVHYGEPADDGSETSPEDSSRAPAPTIAQSSRAPTTTIAQSSRAPTTTIVPTSTSERSPSDACFGKEETSTVNVSTKDGDVNFIFREKDVGTAKLPEFVTKVLDIVFSFMPSPTAVKLYLCVEIDEPRATFKVFPSYVSVDTTKIPLLKALANSGTVSGQFSFLITYKKGAESVRGELFLPSIRLDVGSAPVSADLKDFSVTFATGVGEAVAMTLEGKASMTLGKSSEIIKVDLVSKLDSSHATMDGTFEVLDKSFGGKVSLSLTPNSYDVTLNVIKPIIMGQLPVIGSLFEGRSANVDSSKFEVESGHFSLSTTASKVIVTDLVVRLEGNNAILNTVLLQADSFELNGEVDWAQSSFSLKSKVYAQTIKHGTDGSGFATLQDFTIILKGSESTVNFLMSATAIFHLPFLGNEVKSTVALAIGSAGTVAFVGRVITTIQNSSDLAVTVCGQLINGSEPRFALIIHLPKSTTSILSIPFFNDLIKVANDMGKFLHVNFANDPTIVLSTYEGEINVLPLTLSGGFTSLQIVKSGLASAALMQTSLDSFSRVNDTVNRDESSLKVVPGIQLHRVDAEIQVSQLPVQMQQVFAAAGMKTESFLKIEIIGGLSINKNGSFKGEIDIDFTGNVAMKFLDLLDSTFKSLTLQLQVDSTSGVEFRASGSMIVSLLHGPPTSIQISTEIGTEHGFVFKGFVSNMSLFTNPDVGVGPLQVSMNLQKGEVIFAAMVQANVLVNAGVHILNVLVDKNVVVISSYRQIAQKLSLALAGLAVGLVLSTVQKTVNIQGVGDVAVTSGIGFFSRGSCIGFAEALSDVPVYSVFVPKAAALLQIAFSQQQGPTILLNAEVNVEFGVPPKWMLLGVDSVNIYVSNFYSNPQVAMSGIAKVRLFNVFPTVELTSWWKMSMSAALRSNASIAVNLAAGSTDAEVGWEDPFGIIGLSLHGLWFSTAFDPKQIAVAPTYGLSRLGFGGKLGLSATTASAQIDGVVDVSSPQSMFFSAEIHDFTTQNLADWLQHVVRTMSLGQKSLVSTKIMDLPLIKKVVVQLATMPVTDGQCPNIYPICKQYNPGFEFIFKAMLFESVFECDMRISVGMNPAAWIGGVKLPDVQVSFAITNAIDNLEKLVELLRDAAKIFLPFMNMTPSIEYFKNAFSLMGVVIPAIPPFGIKKLGIDDFSLVQYALSEGGTNKAEIKAYLDWEMPVGVPRKIRFTFPNLQSVVKMGPRAVIELVKDEMTSQIVPVVLSSISDSIKLMFETERTISQRGERWYLDFKMNATKAAQDTFNGLRLALPVFASLLVGAEVAAALVAGGIGFMAGGFVLVVAGTVCAVVGTVSAGTSILLFLLSLPAAAITGLLWGAFIAASSTLIDIPITMMGAMAAAIPTIESVSIQSVDMTCLIVKTCVLSEYTASLKPPGLHVKGSWGNKESQFDITIPAPSSLTEFGNIMLKELMKGVQKATGVQCLSNDSCESTRWCSFGRCIPKLPIGIPCFLNNDSCESGLCVIQLGIAGGKFDLVPTCQVRECRGDGDCSSDKYCLTTEGRCLAKVGGGTLCSRDGVCTSGKCAFFSCAYCSSDSNCNGNEFCDGVRCQSKQERGLCSRDQMCATNVCSRGMCSLSSGKECLFPTDCVSNQCGWGWGGCGHNVNVDETYDCKFLVFNCSHRTRADWVGDKLCCQ